MPADKREVWVVEVRDKSCSWTTWSVSINTYPSSLKIGDVVGAMPHWKVRVVRYVPAPAPKKAKARKS